MATLYTLKMWGNLGSLDGQGSGNALGDDEDDDDEKAELARAADFKEGEGGRKQWTTKTRPLPWVMLRGGQNITRAVRLGGKVQEDHSDR